ncbi:hypothetical protein ACOSQ2_033130 [Xanthoceras sorbifolium]
MSSESSSSSSEGSTSESSSKSVSSESRSIGSRDDPVESGNHPRSVRGPRVLASSEYNSEDYHQNNLEFSRFAVNRIRENRINNTRLSVCREEFSIPSDVGLRIPNIGEQVSNPEPRCGAIHPAFLEIGMCLPLQPYVRRFLMEVGLAPAKLSSNSWRILIGMWCLWRLNGIDTDPTFSEIKHCYKLVGHTRDGDGWWHLSSWTKLAGHSLIIKQPSSNKEELTIGGREQRVRSVFGFLGTWERVHEKDLTVEERDHINSAWGTRSDHRHIYYLLDVRVLASVNIIPEPSSLRLANSKRSFGKKRKWAGKSDKRKMHPRGRGSRWPAIGNFRHQEMRLVELYHQLEHTEAELIHKKDMLRCTQRDLGESREEVARLKARVASLKKKAAKGAKAEEYRGRLKDGRRPSTMNFSEVHTQYLVLKVDPNFDFEKFEEIKAAEWGTGEATKKADSPKEEEDSLLVADVELSEEEVEEVGSGGDSIGLPDRFDRRLVPSGFVIVSIGGWSLLDYFVRGFYLSVANDHGLTIGVNASEGNLGTLAAGIRKFPLGELVLKKVIPSTKNPTEGTLGDNWEGPESSSSLGESAFSVASPVPHSAALISSNFSKSKFRTYRIELSCSNANPVIITHFPSCTRIGGSHEIPSIVAYEINRLIMRENNINAGLGYTGPARTRGPLTDLGWFPDSTGSSLDPIDLDSEETDFEEDSEVLPSEELELDSEDIEKKNKERILITRILTYEEVTTDREICIHQTQKRKAPEYKKIEQPPSTKKHPPKAI